MNEIHVLSKEVAELIAAGEVIERPASVIKEIVENSVDAGAKHITVEIKNGGTTFMRISDDGCGIAEGQVETAFMRHATSKIESKDDLNKIYTLGFRGEALASVTAVSKVDVITKQSEEEYGTHYVAEGGVPLILEKVGCSNGTVITVRELFFNVPARQKFLKKDVAEGNAIAIIIHKIALSHPEIAFKFLRDGKTEINSLGDGQLYSAIYSVYGKTFAGDMLEVDYEENNIKVKGYIVKPLYSKANRSFQNFFINGRYIKSQTCSIAIEEAYKGVVMTGKFPACILNISISPAIIDVNVHPSKAEVRFSDEKIIFNAIYFAVKNSFMKNNMMYEFQFDNRNSAKNAFTFEKKEENSKGVTKSSIIDEKTVDIFKNKEVSEKKDTAPLIEKTFPVVKEEKTEVKEIETDANTVIEDSIFENDVLVEKIKEAGNVENDDFKKETLKGFNYISKEIPEKVTKTESKVTNENIIPHSLDNQKKIVVIGEVFCNYIMAEAEGSIIMIDKHAGHERIIYEKLRSQDKKVESQLIINTGGILISENEFQALEENVEMLENMGFKFDFSSKPYIIPKAIPIFLSDENMDEIIPELAENIYLNKINPQTHFLDDMFHSIACKAAIKANDKNSMEELQSLAEQVYYNENIRHCPHGRPVMFVMTKKDVEKQFKRIQ